MIMPANIASDPDLLERLRSPGAHPVTREQAEAQRASFVYGNLPHTNTLTREEVEEHLKRMDGGTQ